MVKSQTNSRCRVRAESKSPERGSRAGSIRERERERRSRELGREGRELGKGPNPLARTQSAALVDRGV